MSGHQFQTFPTFQQNSKKFNMQQIEFLLFISLTFLVIVPSVNSFNLDARYYYEIYSKPNEYFGYSIEFKKDTNHYKILVGSPKANDTTPDVSPGALYECYVKPPHNCRLVLINQQVGLLFSRQNQWLGVALDINPINSRITVCAHRLREHNSNADSLPGACYELYNTSSQIAVQYHINYFNANFGISCRYSKFGKLLIGVPGARQYMFPGGYYMDNNFYPNVRDDYYEGYTVSFLNNQFPVIGKPRYREYGAVLVENSLVLPPQTKYSFGSYFGSVIATADFNQDGYEDLVIGAPFYSEKLIEEGRVYIYYFDVAEQMFSDDAIVLMEPHYRAQFGKSLVTGHFNEDRYQDLIVGAPYENEGMGCIYVYNGKQGGLDSKYSQKICGENLRPGLQTFGISFTRAVDIDQNGCEDIGVGAYLSDYVYIFRARPTVSMETILTVSNPLLDIEPNCLDNERRVLCVYLNVTLLSNSHIPMLYHYHLITDSSRPTDAKRTYFNGRLHEIIEKVTVQQEFKMTYKIFIKNAVDILMPINFTVHTYPYDQGYSQACKSLCPISKNSTSSIKVRFNLKCGSDEICQTQLKVKLELLPPNVTLGKDKTLFAVVNVFNLGEHAYNAKTRIFFSPFMDFESVSNSLDSPVECSSVNKMELSCFLGNPLKEKKQSSFILKFLIGQISNMTKAFIAVNASTDSQVEPEYLVNTINSTILFHRKSDLELAATSVPDTMVFTGKDGSMISRHVYNLRNNGPSDALNLIFSVDIPYVFINKVQVMSIKEYRMHSGNINALDTPTDIVCRYRAEREVKADEIKTDFKSLIKHRNVANCSWLRCRRIICELSNLPVVNTKIFELALSINTTILKLFQGKLRVFDFVSNGTLKHKMKDQIINVHHNKANATTSYIISRLRKKIQWWIVVLSILVGLLFLIIVGLILWKLGFFQRNRVTAEDRKSLAVANENTALSEQGPGADES